MKDRSQPSGLQRNRVTRRRFVKGAAAGVATFTIVPRHVLGGPEHNPPSERLNLALIGVGGQGRSLLGKFENQNIVALCDADDTQMSRAQKRFPNATKHRDFRVLLEKGKDIDGVVVATTDNLHAPVSMMALKMGKHVYCEKPLTHTVYEARELAIAAREAKVATQMGNSGQASESTRRNAEYIADGAIGDVREVHVWTDRPLNWWPQGSWSTGGYAASPEYTRLGSMAGSGGSSVLTTQTICRLSGAAGGTMVREPSATSVATAWLRFFGP